MTVERIDDTPGRRKDQHPRGMRENDQDDQECFSSRRMRHVDMKHNVVRDAIDERIVVVEHGCSEEQHTDILMKP